MLGKAQIICYGSVEAEEKRAVRGAIAPSVKRGRRRLPNSMTGKRPRTDEKEHGKSEMEALSPRE